MPSMAGLESIPVSSTSPDKPQVEAGANGHLKGVPGGLVADPGPAVSEENPVKEPHLLVVDADCLSQ